MIDFHLIKQLYHMLIYICNYFVKLDEIILDTVRNIYVFFSSIIVKYFN